MKNSYSCLLMLIFLTSCNKEPLATEERAANIIFHKENDIVPYNSNNPYEEVGRIHDELFETYYEEGNLPGTVTAICSRVEDIAGVNIAFNNLKEIAYQPLVPAKIEYIAQYKSGCVADIIEGTSLSASAKLSLAVFINAFVQVFESEYSGEVLYSYVAAYENTVVTNQAFTTNDKRIILITTSIARHSACLARKKPKKNTDPDWTILVGNIIAAVEGAKESGAKAITMALAAGVATN